MTETTLTQADIDANITNDIDTTPNETNPVIAAALAAYGAKIAPTVAAGRSLGRHAYARRDCYRAIEAAAGFVYGPARNGSDALRLVANMERAAGGYHA